MQILSELYFSDHSYTVLLGYREKVFAIIGIKVYAAALYANQSIFSKLDAWKSRSAVELQQDSSLVDAMFQGKYLNLIAYDDRKKKIGSA